MTDRCTMANLPDSGIRLGPRSAAAGTPSFSVSRAASALIRAIADRAKKADWWEQLGCSHFDLMMDLTATHANGCPMDFEGLLAADSFDLAHDLSGICIHLDRKTGRLVAFLPRYSERRQR